MTTGSWTITPELSDTHQHGISKFGVAASKTWSGANGKYRPDGSLNWNAYTMRHRSARITGTPTYNYATPPVGYWDTVRWKKPSTGQLFDVARVDPVYAYTRLTVPYFTGFGSVTPWTTQDEYKLQGRLLNKVKGHDFHVGVSLAEVDKTASHMVSTVKQLGFGIADLAAGQFERFARRLGTYPPNREVTRRMRTLDISGRYLEMTYAVAPVIQDAFAVGKAFEALSNGPRRKVFKATVNKSVWDSFPSGNGGGGGFIRYSRTYMYEAYEELSAIRQMGLADPLSILWERVPYSFVFDWFIPVGTYLNLIGQVPHLKGRFMLIKYAKKVQAARNVMGNPPSGYTTYVSGPRTIKTEHTEYDRTILGSLPVPLPSLRVSGAVQGRRLLNAVALSHQLLANAADFLGGKPVLRKGRIKYTEDATAGNLLQKLRRL